MPTSPQDSHASHLASRHTTPSAATAAQPQSPMSASNRGDDDIMKTQRGPEFYAQIGRRGGETTKKRYGPEFYSNIGRKGGSATRSDKKAKPATTNN